MSELEVMFSTLTIGELYELLREAEHLRSKSILPIEAKTRKISEKLFGNSDVINMIKVHHEVYRYFALNDSNSLL